MKLYLSGPMTGIPDHNYPAFNGAAMLLREKGHTVINPAEVDGGDQTQTHQYYMRRDLSLMLDNPDLEGLVYLDGWQNSTGANFETVVATAIGLKFFDYVPEEAFGIREHITENILEEANRLIYGARQSSYGHPLDDFTRTGRLWAPILGLETVTPEQVALCMVAVKISRECNKPKRDNRVDGAGYFGCLQLIHDKNEKSLTSE